MVTRFLVLMRDTLPGLQYGMRPVLLVPCPNPGRPGIYRYQEKGFGATFFITDAGMNTDTANFLSWEDVAEIYRTDHCSLP